jgi:voltage-gated potassium channel
VDTEGLRGRLRLLYHGHSPTALRFRLAVLLVDLVILGFFIATPVLRGRPSFYWIDYSVAALVAIDLAARMLASTDIPRWLRQPTSLIDLLILVTLLAPDWLGNLGFLRVLRLWTLSRNSFVWQPLQRFGLEDYEDAGRSVVNLLTFLFVVTGFVYTFFAHPDSGIDGYIDALYFTVTTVTTTGYGDIVLPGIVGKLTSIVVMITGISLFVRLAQSIFRPRKVTFPCPQCGLRRHDPDAVHCKACGHLLKIPDEGN